MKGDERGGGRNKIPNTTTELNGFVYYDSSWITIGNSSRSISSK